MTNMREIDDCCDRIQELALQLIRVAEMARPDAGSERPGSGWVHSLFNNLAGELNLLDNVLRPDTPPDGHARRAQDPARERSMPNKRRDHVDRAHELLRALYRATEAARNGEPDRVRVAEIRSHLAHELNALVAGSAPFVDDFDNDIPF